MDVVADLLALVAEHLVFAALEVAFDQVAEKSVQLDAGVIGTGKTSAAQAAGGHIEVAAVLLHHNVAGDFRGAKERVLALIDGKVSAMPFS